MMVGTQGIIKKVKYNVEIKLKYISSSCTAILLVYGSGFYERVGNLMRSIAGVIPQMFYHLILLFVVFILFLNKNDSFSQYGFQVCYV